MINKKFKMEKKGMSEVVTTILMVGLVLALIAIVWNVINNMVSSQIHETEACFGNFDKITINRAYTCYNLPTNETYFSINVEDINLDEIFIVIGSKGVTNSIILSSTITNITGVTNYEDNSSGVIAPAANHGKTYIYAGLKTAPDYIRISPVISGEKCQQSDSFENIEACSSYD